MPYRVDVDGPDPDAVLRLLELGALDVDADAQGHVAVVMPDAVSPDDVARAVGGAAVRVSSAIGRDADSVWQLRPRVLRVGRVRLVPASSDEPPQPGDIRLVDTAAFGTGQHPTTTLCLDVLDELIDVVPVASMLDVGTGSGVLALAALAHGVAHVTAFDVDADAVRATFANARLNDVAARLRVVHGGPDVVDGRWPLVVANILAAPLIELAPLLASRVAHAGRLVLSGMPVAVQEDVARAYRRVGMHVLDVRTRAGWCALVCGASW